MHNNKGWINELPLANPLNFITIQNAFPIPTNHYKPWMRKTEFTTIVTLFSNESMLYI